MNPLDLLPWWAKAAILAAIVAAAVWAVHSYNEGLREDGRQEVRAEIGKQAAQEAEQNAKETQRRLARLKESEDAYQKDRARLAADAAGARAAAVSLREQVDQLEQLARGVACRDSATAGERETAAAAGSLLAELQRRADERAGILASFADEARAAGLACERAYRALTP